MRFLDFLQKHPLFFEGEGGGAAGGGNLEGVDDLNQDLAALESGEEESGEEDEELEEDDETPTRKPKERAKDDGEEDEEGDEEDPDADEDDEETSDDEDEEEEEDPEKKGEKPGDEDAKPVVVGRPTAKQLKDAGVFKQFPALREMYFNYPKFQEQFATPEDAQVVVTKAAHYDEIEEQVLGGNVKGFLETVKEGSAEGYKKFVSGLLPTIREMDGDAYFQNAVEPIIREMVFHATAHGKKIGGKEGENLIRSAKWISNYVFADGGEIQDITKAGGKHPAEVALEEEREKAAKRELARASGDVNGRIDRTLKIAIGQGMSNRLSAIEREFIVNKTLDETMTQINKDPQFGTRFRQLWRKARTSEYSEQSKVAIYQALVARANPLVREIRDRLTREALKGKKKPIDATGEEQTNQKKVKKRTFDSSGRGGGSGRRSTVLDSRKIDWRKTSDLDILSDEGGDKVKLKGRN